MPLLEALYPLSRKSMPLRKSRKKIDDPESLKLLLNRMDCNQGAYQCILNCAADFVNFLDDVNHNPPLASDIPAMCEYILRINSYRSSPASLSLTAEQGNVFDYKQKIGNLYCVIYALKTPAIPLLFIYDSHIVTEGQHLCSFSRFTPEGQTICSFTKCKGSILGTLDTFPRRADYPLFFAPSVAILTSVHRIMGRSDTPNLTFDEIQQYFNMNLMNDNADLANG